MVGTSQGRRRRCAGDQLRKKEGGGGEGEGHGQGPVEEGGWRGRDQSGKEAATVGTSQSRKTAWPGKEGVAKEGMAREGGGCGGDQ